MTMPWKIHCRGSYESTRVPLGRDSQWSSPNSFGANGRISYFQEQVPVYWIPTTVSEIGNLQSGVDTNDPEVAGHEWLLSISLCACAVRHRTVSTLNPRFQWVGLQLGNFENPEISLCLYHQILQQLGRTLTSAWTERFGRRIRE